MKTKKNDAVTTMLMLIIALMIEPWFHAILLLVDRRLLIARWRTRDTMFHAAFERRSADHTDTDPLWYDEMMGGHVHDDVELTESDASRFSRR